MRGAHLDPQQPQDEHKQHLGIFYVISLTLHYATAILLLCFFAKAACEREVEMEQGASNITTAGFTKQLRDGTTSTATEAGAMKDSTADHASSTMKDDSMISQEKVLPYNGFHRLQICMTDFA